MKNRIHKIMGVSLSLVIAMALIMGFAAPASAAETINEWYKFDYPGPGADDGWLYSPDIMRVGEIIEAIDGTLYVHVRRCVPEARLWVTGGTVTTSEFDSDTDTGTIVGEIEGYWDSDAEDWTADERAAFEAFLPTDFVAFLELTTGPPGTICMHGTATATGLTFEGSEEDPMSGFFLSSTWDILGGRVYVMNCGQVITGAWYMDEVGGGADGPQGFYGRLNGAGDDIFKSTDGGRTWEETDYPGGWVVDMAASSLDADILYAADGHYVYKTSDAGDDWTYVKQDSLEEQLSGACHVPACCYCDECQWHDCDICPSCSGSCNEYPYNCPITSIDVTYDDSDNPYVFIGTRKHCSGIDLDGDTYLDEFPGEVYWISEAGYPSNWSGLGLDCYRNGTYDAIAVGCAPDWADTNETYVVVSTDDDNGNGTLWEAGDAQTHVVSTTGGPCDWPEYAELLWDCTTSFASKYASRIAFPDDWEDTETLFVGVVDCNECEDCYYSSPNWYSCGGDVYLHGNGRRLLRHECSGHFHRLYRH